MGTGGTSPGSQSGSCLRAVVRIWIWGALCFPVFFSLWMNAVNAVRVGEGASVVLHFPMSGVEEGNPGVQGKD